MIKLSEYTKFAIDVAKKAGSLQMLYFGNITEIKKKSSHIDILTEADTKSEKLIIKEITKKYPNHSIVSEESNDIYNAALEIEKEGLDNYKNQEEYNKKANSLRKKVIDYQSQRRASLDKIASQRAESREKLLGALDPIMNDYIKENNISVIIDKKNILGGQTNLDITNLMIEKLDKELQSLNLK